MRDRLRSFVLAVGAVGSLMVPFAPTVASAAPSCEKLLNSAALKVAKVRLAKAGAACRKAPGGSCYAVAVQLIPASKKLSKACDSATITTLFGGRCSSRDTVGSHKPSSVTTIEHVVTCISYAVAREVDCLTATMFARGNMPDGCVGSPSAAFIDAEDEE